MHEELKHININVISRLFERRSYSCRMTSRFSTIGSSPISCLHSGLQKKKRLVSDQTLRVFKALNEGSAHLSAKVVSASRAPSSTLLSVVERSFTRVYKSHHIIRDPNLFFIKHDEAKVLTIMWQEKHNLTSSYFHYSLEHKAHYYKHICILEAAVFIVVLELILYWKMLNIIV